MASCPVQRSSVVQTKGALLPLRHSVNSHDPDSSYIHRVHIYEAQATDGIRR